ncbi:rhomboid family intramembrane serine protease [Roseibacillus ishigakijimensis]|uniref:Rhomboid family intramembrane serine protease n=1 Tax=Roseibacillus ishigakijimensis TaxID=454146 RepID=A0A934RM16_9BACT|nr:rhomboid family intramembrane serine protease [Roseibacillus ishigakijimensis]MBK1833260.1 rhomboid family intramembrane serine protease [Roseibacillus ishigakijimensis]
MEFRPKRLRFPRPGWNFHTLVPATLLLIFLPCHLTGGTGGPLAPWYQVFGLSQDNLWPGGQAWTLLTYAFLHGTPLHWFTNAFFIYYFGGRLHDIFGEKEVWRTALLATLGGGLAHALGNDGLLVGASGAGLGLFIALTTISPESRFFPLPVRARNLRDGILIATTALLALSPALGIPLLSDLGRSLSHLLGPEIFQIGHACHLGGALAGMAAMRKYHRKPITLAQLRKERAEREARNTDAA